MKKITFLLFTLFLLGCDSGILWEDKHFSVYWIDNPKNIKLGRKVEGGYIGISSPPFSIGSDERYLVVKTQYGYNYYDKNIEDKSSQSLFRRVGPLSKEKFLNAKKELSLPELEVAF